MSGLTPSPVLSGKPLFPAWTPSAAERAGRYYYCFSAGDGAEIGVAVSDSATGPFRDVLGSPLIKEYHFGAQPIDAYHHARRHRSAAR